VKFLDVLVQLLAPLPPLS